MIVLLEFWIIEGAELLPLAVLKVNISGVIYAIV